MTEQKTLRIATLLLGAGLLAACDPPGVAGPVSTDPVPAAMFDPITTERDFRERVVGREVVYPDGAIGTYGADNTWTITDEQGTVAQGTWTWREDRWCYGGSIDGGPIQIRCDEVAVSDTGVRFTREEGTSGVLPFRI
jgi:hypothetical protein